MLQPDKNVHNLLYHNDCVIIPGFGGFIKRENPTVLDKGKELIKPKGQSVFFNGALIQNDGLLVQHIAAELNQNYKDALSKVEEWVKKADNELSVSGRLKFGILGTFFISNEGKKWFAPNTSINFSKNTFGLESIVAKTILNKEKIEVAVVNNKEENIAISTPNRVKKKSSWLKVAASISLLAIASTFVWLWQTSDNTGVDSKFQNAQLLNIEDTFMPTIDEVEDLPIQTDEDPDSVFTDLEEAESIQSPINFPIDNPFEEEIKNIEVISEKVLETENTAATEYNLTILAGAFLLEHNAKRRIEFLTAKGFEIFPAKPQHSRLLRIQCGKFANKEDAKVVLNELQNIIPEAFITELKYNYE